jgi:hypothetical protein
VNAFCSQKANFSIGAGLYLKPSPLLHHCLATSFTDDPSPYSLWTASMPGSKEAWFRTWLRITHVSLWLLTIPTSFPVVQLAGPFGARAVSKGFRDFPQFDDV